jgi:Helix-turn-helix domain
MRALAHPLRLTLFELVMREGTLTSTQASELTGESTGSCSFHLRQLAKYGFVEEAPGGKGRERPWRPAGISFGWSGVQEDAAMAAAAEALSDLMLDRRMRDLHAYLRRRVAESAEWREAALSMGNLLYLRPDELAALSEQIVRLLRPYAERTGDPSQRPADARAVQLFAYGFPLPRTATGN